MENIKQLIEEKEKELNELKQLLNKKQDMRITLTDSEMITVLNKILKTPFETEVCGCGHIEFELNEKYIFVLSRKCRNSSDCDNECWELHLPELIINRNYRDDECFDYVNINREQMNLIFKLGKLKSYVELKESRNYNKEYNEIEFYEELFEDVKSLFE